MGCKKLGVKFLGGLQFLERQIFLVLLATCLHLHGLQKRYFYQNSVIILVYVRIGTLVMLH